MATPALHLTVVKGPKKGATLDRKPGTLIRIGRVIKGNTFAIKDASISQRHLVIKFLPEILRWAVEDLDTSNGTLINDVRIDPSVPFPLSDGDTVKIGESTSISVEIEGAEAETGKEEKNVQDSRRNAGNRRGRSKKADGVVDSVVEEEICVDSRGVVGNRRGRSKKTEDSVGVVEDTVEKSKNLGRERPRRGNSRVTRKDEALDAVSEDPVEESRNLRRGRSRRVDSCKVSKEDEVSDLVVEDSAEVPVEKSKNLRRGRPRKGDSSKVSKEDEVSDLVVADSTKVPKNAGRTRARRSSMMKVLEEEVAPEAISEAQEVAGKGKVDGGSDGGDECKVVGRGEETKIRRVEEESIVNIEKMTLGEWFDSMEKFLPMSINDVAEEIISSLREKACRFDEFVGKASDANA